MKQLFVFLFLFPLISHSQDYYTQKEKEYTDGLSSLSNEQIWDRKVELASKAHSKQIFGTVFLSAGLPTLVYGSIESVRYKNEESYIIIGSGIVLTVVGAILSFSSMNDKKKVIWVEKEIHKRSGAKLSASAKGIRLTF